MGDDSDSGRGFEGETGAGFGRFVGPLGVKRDLLEDFIVSGGGRESVKAARRILF